MTLYSQGILGAELYPLLSDDASCDGVSEPEGGRVVEMGQAGTRQAHKDGCMDNQSNNTQDKTKNEKKMKQEQQRMMTKTTTQHYPSLVFNPFFLPG